MKKTLLALMFATPAAFALEGISFSHQDWDIACDNTGTCRAAGYQNEADGDSPAEPISLLLIRKAGAHEAVQAYMQIISDDIVEDKAIETKLTLHLNGKALGEFVLPPGKSIWELDEQQTAAILAALPQKTAEIVVTTDSKRTMTLSDKGAAAVLLKMDEFQQRLDTPSALIKKGKSDKAVLAPVAKPRIKVVIPPKEDVRVLEAGSQEALALLELFSKDFKGENAPCELRDGGQGFNIYPLGNGRVLTETYCWLAAYNGASHYAIASDDLKRVITPITSRDDTSDYGFNDYNPEHAELSGSFKGRGLGDCWLEETRVYDGNTFVPSAITNYGQCKGFSGGAWPLPTWVTEVIEPQNALP